MLRECCFFLDISKLSMRVKRFRQLNQIGYEPADLTVHPHQNNRGWVHFFRIGV